MSKFLTPLQITHHHTYGYIAPIRVMPQEQALWQRERLEEFERTQGERKGLLRHKPHLLFTWLADLVRHEKILDAIEDLYGENLLCWTSNFFIKEGKDPTFVSWHEITNRNAKILYKGVAATGVEQPSEKLEARLPS